VSETAAANGPDRFVSPQAPPWEEIEHAATPMRVARRTEQWPQTQVALSREDTAIVLSSRTLTAEALLDAAASLVPARRPG